MSNLQTYGKWEDDEVENDKRESESAGGSDFAKIKSGRNTYRFLPPKLGAKSPIVRVLRHFIEVPGVDKIVNIVCPRSNGPANLRRPCIVCREVTRLQDTQSSVDEQRAYDLKAKLACFAAVIDRSIAEEGPKILQFGKSVDEQLILIRETEGDYTDPTDAGFDIHIEKSGQKKQTKYKVLYDRDNSALGDMAWLEQLPSLQRYATIPSDEEIAEMLSGMGFDGAGGGGGGRRNRGPAPGRGGRGGGGSASGGRTAMDDAIDTTGETSDD
jgi:hypothetical protein